VWVIAAALLAVLSVTLVLQLVNFPRVFVAGLSATRLRAHEIFLWASVFQGYPPDYAPKEEEFRKTFREHEGAMPNVFTVGPTANEAYKLSSGTRSIPQYSYADALKANVVLAPGGHGSLRFRELQRNGTPDYIRAVATAPDNKYIMSV
jgi:hypothetical protein